MGHRQEQYLEVGGAVFHRLANDCVGLRLCMELYASGRRPLKLVHGRLLLDSPGQSSVVLRLRVPSAQMESGGNTRLEQERHDQRVAVRCHAAGSALRHGHLLRDRLRCLLRTANALCSSAKQSHCM